MPEAIRIYENMSLQPFVNCFTSRGSIGAKQRKARTMEPKRHAGTRASGDGEWRMFRKPKTVEAPPKTVEAPPKKERKDRHERR